MANRSVVVDLIVNTGKWTAGFQKASHDMASATTNAETKVKALQMQVGLLGVGLTAFAAVAVAKWAAFDQAMARVEATGGSAASSIDKLTNAAMSDTVTQLGYSATEAAESIYELTKAGVEASDITGGALAGSMALAAAETMDASESAAIMASALTQFNLEGTESAHVADLLVAAAGKAQGSAHDLGFALKQSGLVADQFGLSIEETVGTLAMFANAGLIGSDAGTSLRTMLLHLAGPSGKSAKLMKELGFSAYDASGEFKNTAEIADSLKVALDGKSEAERNAALATIFGADATRAASLLLREGGDAVVEWTEKVNEAGYATSVAFKRMDNLTGDVKKLSSAFDKMMINIGSSADGPLRGLVQGITVAVDAFGKMPDAVSGVVMALAGGGGLGVLGVLAVSQLFNAINTLKTGLVEAGVAGEAMANRIATGMKVATLATGALLTAATIGLTVWASKTAEAKAAVEEWKSTLDGLGNTTDSTLSGINDKLSETHDVWWQFGEDQRSIKEITDDYGVSIKDVQQAILGSESAYDRVQSAMAKAHEGMAIGSVAAGQWSNANEYLFGTIDTLGGQISKATTEQERKVAMDEAAGLSAGDLAEQTNEAAQAAAEQAEQDRLAAEASKERADAISALVDQMKLQKSIQDELAGEAADVRETNKAQKASLDAMTEALEKNGKTLDLNTEKGRANDDALQKYKDDVLAHADALLASGTSQKKVNDFLDRAREKYISAAESMGASTAEAEAMADAMGLIPDVSIKVDADTAPAREKGESAASYIDEMQAYISILANPDIARQEGESTADYIARLQATITVDGNAVPARKKGESAEAYISRLQSTIGIDGNEALAKKKGETAAEYISRLEGIINTTSNTHDAMANAESARAAIDAMSATINVTTLQTIKTQRINLGKSQIAAGTTGGLPKNSGGRLQAFASGGRLPGQSPVNPWEDNLLGVDENGRARALVRSREWVVNEQASDYYGDGFMRAINERRFPRTLPGFAAGGRFGGKGRIDYTPRGHSLEYWQSRYKNSSERLDTQIQIRDLKRDLREKEKGKYTLRGLDRKRAEKDLKVAQQEMKDAKAASAVRNKLNMSFDAAIKKRDREQQKKDKAADIKRDKAQSARETRTAISRGEIKSDLTSGMSGVYGVTDDARGLISSGQVTGKAADRLAWSIRAAEGSAKGLYAQSAKIATALEKAKDQADDLRQIKEEVANGIIGGFGLADVEGTLNQWTGERAAPTGQQFLQAAQAYAGKAKAFAGKLSALQKKGFSGVILQEIAGMGVEAGSAAADALLSLNATDTKSLNTAFTDISKWANYAGEAVTGGFFKGGLAAADGIVKGLESKQASVEKAIENMALGMQNALKRALGIKSPSRVFRSMMKFVGDGAALGIEDQKGKVGAKASELLEVAAGRYTTGATPVSVTLPYSGPSAGDAGGAAGANDNAVTKADLQSLAGMIVQGFEKGTLRHLRTYASVQDSHRVRQQGTRR